MTQRQADPGSKSADPYDNGLYMPLHDFIEEPIVKDLLHNGAALQVRCAFRAITLHLLDLLMHHAFQTLGRNGPDGNYPLRSAGFKQMAGIAWHACSLMHLCPACHRERSLSQAIFCHLDSRSQTALSTISGCGYCVMKVHASSVGVGRNYPHTLAGRGLTGPVKIPFCGLHGYYEVMCDMQMMKIMIVMSA